MNRIGLFIACLLASATLAATPSRTRADDGLIVTSQAVYEVRPESREASVRVDVAVTNVTPDTATERTYYTGISLPIPVEATRVSASAGGAPLDVTLEPGDEMVQFAAVGFGADLFFQQTYRFTLQFTLADAGGDPERDTWIRGSFVSLPVWAFGSPGATGASVEVILPPGYEVSFAVGEMEVTSDSDATRAFADSIEDPASFIAYLTAERPGDRAREHVTIELAEETASLMLMAWPDDPEWAERQSRVLAGGFPALEAAIGLPYPIVGVLTISEHAYEHLGDYSGVFLEGDDVIEMRFDADAFTALHEAAHVWFNGSLASERWLLEGFASYYAELAAAEIAEEVTTYEVTDELREAAFALLEWGEPWDEDPAREDFGYAASYVLAREIAELAGADGLRAVWSAADADRPAYASDPDERLRAADERPEDWQRFLDLFENETGADFDPLWIEWVVDADDAEALEEREEARAAYDATSTAAGDWEIPASTRLHMGAWEFDDAVAELGEVQDLIDAYADLVADAEALALEAPDEVGDLLASHGLDAARAEVDLQRRAVEAIGETETVLDGERDLFEVVGLLGEEQPDLRLQAARAAFEGTDDEAAIAEANAATNALEEAGARGPIRVAIAGGAIVAIGAVGVGVAIHRRRRRSAPLVGEP